MSAPLLLCLLCALGNSCCAAGSQISGLSNSSTAPFCWQASSSFVLMPPLEGASASQSYKLVQPAWSCLAEHWHKNGEHSLMQDVQ